MAVCCKCTKPEECQGYCKEHLIPQLDKWFEGMGKAPDNIDLKDENVRLVIAAVRSIYFDYTKDARNSLMGILSRASRQCEKCQKRIPYPAPCEFTFDSKPHYWCPGCKG